MIIRKKVQEEYFEAVKQGKKRFEVRLADFKCEEGDTLILTEQKQGTNIITGRELELEVLYKFNIKDMEKFHNKKDIEKYGFVILSIKRK